MKKFSILTLLVFTALACNVKPPTDEDMKGTPVSKSEIDNAFTEATSGVSDTQAYRVSDYGTLRIIDFVMTNAQLVSTYDLKVEEINDQFIIYTQKELETGDIKKYGIPRSATVNTPKEPVGKTNLFQKIKGLVLKVANLFKKIEIERPTAIGQEKPEFRILSSPLAVSGKNLKIAATSSSGFKSQYYDLKIIKHPYETANCAQIPGCKVNATRIEYYEVRTLSDGTTMKMKWMYEVSKEVPGLFFILDECYSTIINQSGQQIPFMECARVKDFRFGP